MGGGDRPAIRRIAIGPAWQRTAKGFIAPERSLGYYLARKWAPRYLLSPDGEGPWQFTPEQTRFLLWWYALDENDRFAYRTGVYRRMKGAGKSPFAAAFCAIELLGPCRVGGGEEDGQPVGVPHRAAWIQTAAVTREQTRNVMQVMPVILSERAVEEFQIDIGKEIIYAHRGRCRMDAVTSSPRALEGGRPTFCVRDETQHWVRSNDGHAMAEVIDRNAAKSPDGATRVLSITNAHSPGMDSVAERDYEAWQQAEAGFAPKDILYDSVESSTLSDLGDPDQLREGIEAARSDSLWLSLDRLVAESLAPTTPTTVVHRYYLNQIVAEEDKPFDEQRFRELVRPDYLVPAGAKITLGFDGSMNRDHTALIGTEIETGHQFVAGYWEPIELPGGERRIPEAEVDQVVGEAFEHWQVWRMYADPSKWGTYLAKWRGEHGEDVSPWATTLYRRMAMAIAQYRESIIAGHLTHDGDPRFVAAVGKAHKHMLNIRDDDGELMYLVQKERLDSPLKIDAAYAACLSWQARSDAIASGVLRDERMGISVYVGSGG